MTWIVRGATVSQHVSAPLGLRGRCHRPSQLAHALCGSIAVLFALVSAASAQDSASSSNASNYGGSPHVTVNPRTGGVSIQAELFHVPGVVERLSTRLVLSYSSDAAVAKASSGTSFFGLPPGWSLNLTYEDTTSNPSRLNVDGAQSYAIDPGWTTQVVPFSGGRGTTVKTGLLQYNKADINYRAYTGSHTVNGTKPSMVLSHLDGRRHYLDRNGLLLQQMDRFGNTVTYTYTGDTPQTATLATITDSWGHTITFSTSRGLTTATLPDGRTVSYTTTGTGQGGTLTAITDAAGKSTRFEWAQTSCLQGGPMLQHVTSAMGSMTALDWQCMNVCQSVPENGGSCANDTADLTTWPVVSQVQSCPNNPSGVACPDSSTTNALTTVYDLHTQLQNYTGYPYVSPYGGGDPQYPGADALMSASGETDFTYVTTETKQKGSGRYLEPAYRTQHTYNFLHLELERQTAVWADDANGQPDWIAVKDISYCYPNNQGDCTGSGFNYQSLPANYQTARMIGTCVYSVPDGGLGNGRRSMITRSFDGFGNRVRSQTYHGTAATGTISRCSRSERLSVGKLKLVLDTFYAYDAPTQLSDQYYTLGEGASHFGLLTGAVTYSYYDTDSSGLPAYTKLSASTTPARVTLRCNVLSDGTGPPVAGAAIQSSTKGSLAVGTAKPSPGGPVGCTAPKWLDTQAPPKQELTTYDGNGRVRTQTKQWLASVSPKPPGIASTSVTFAYDDAVASDTGEAPCPTVPPGGKAVLQVKQTDAAGKSSYHRTCTTNGFRLATIAKDGSRTTYTSNALGQVTEMLLPNGSSTQTAYHYACPKSPQGLATCPNTLQPGCPVGTTTLDKACLVQRLAAGTDPVTGQANTSAHDGVWRASVLDGLGRRIAAYDNLGGKASGQQCPAGGPQSDYCMVQQRAADVLDSLGQRSSSTAQLGVTTPIVYTTTATYDARLRPKQICGPRGEAHEFVHDQVTQQIKQLLNGHQHRQLGLNDSHKLTEIVDCPLVTTTPGQGSGACQTVANTASLSSATCSGDGHYTSMLRDGLGVSFGTTAWDPSGNSGGSVSSVQGLSSLAADNLDYTYAVNTQDAANGKVGATAGLSGQSTFDRDLLGHSLASRLTLTDPTTKTTSSVESEISSYNALAQLTGTVNPLGSALTEGFTYTDDGELATVTPYSGDTFHLVYDTMHRLVRHCGPSDNGSEGEKYTRDPLTGQALSVTHFTNPGSCSACTEASCKSDVDGDSIAYEYTPFGALSTQIYTQAGATTIYMWSYDEYQRVTCYADAVATAAGESCPASPTPAGWQPQKGSLLTWYSFYPDDDPQGRRGYPKSMCRGLPAGQQTLTRCYENDWYTSTTKGGACSQFSGLADVVGAFPGQLKSRTLCSDGPCAEGGTKLTTTTHLYDPFARTCAVEMRNTVAGENDQNQLILGAYYRYDHYNNLLSERHASDLDPSEQSNTTTTYTYDGLMRLVLSVRDDKNGNLVEQVAYTYDAASNVVKSVETYAQASATTSQYWFNADGALAKAVVQAGNQPPTTTYFTWDIFTPDETVEDPTKPWTGTIPKEPGNGNLLGFGPSPGQDYTERFVYDARSRMTSATANGETASYTFHPTSLVASAQTSEGEPLEFFYQGQGVANMTQGSRSSASVGNVRQVSDGTQQILVKPGKDVAGVYDATSQTFTPYVYDDYGADASGPEGHAPAPEESPGYDIADNPFQYAGEFRDPVWGGYYLRARWYDPRWRTFLSRDPDPNLNRYGYTDGNPITRVDPTGRSWQGFMDALNSHEPGWMVLFGAARLLLPVALWVRSRCSGTPSSSRMRSSTTRTGSTPGSSAASWPRPSWSSCRSSAPRSVPSGPTVRAGSSTPCSASLAPSALPSTTDTGKTHSPDSSTPPVDSCSDTIWLGSDTRTPSI